ncbi:MAG: hypothetical protein NT010_16030 [Proteobacteria bacterium]|nr:hypothetical protein [Pseudomonadota bacterium]
MKTFCLFYSGIASAPEKLMLIRFEWATAWKKCFRCGWAVSLADRKLYMRMLEGARRRRAPQMDISITPLTVKEKTWKQPMFIKQQYNLDNKLLTKPGTLKGSIYEKS